MKKHFLKNDTGAVEFNAILVLFFIVAIVSSGVMFASSGITYTRTGSRDFDIRSSADMVLNSIIEDLQPLKSFQFDDKDNALISELRNKYAMYNLCITDVSSGYNLNFLSDADISDSNLSRFLFRDRTGAAFTLLRNTNGLTENRELWRELINDEAWEACISYGWLHIKDVNSFAFRRISASFNENDTAKFFPLINDFPRMNVNMVNPDILYPLITRSVYNIEKAQEKADILANRLRSGGVIHTDISSTLGIAVNHPLMEYFGTKTAFWKIHFVMQPSLEVKAIVAAVPKKDGAVQEIEAYRLISRSFVND